MRATTSELSQPLNEVADHRKIGFSNPIHEKQQLVLDHLNHNKLQKSIWPRSILNTEEYLIWIENKKQKN
jgi:hypothetical protein